jgi:tRNA 2-thiouridine synthesizing protein C
MSSHALETLESILVAGVFDLDVSVLFRNDALYQLLNDQDGSQVGQRTHGKVLAALPEYGVDDIYVCQGSLERLRLGTRDLCLPVTVLSDSQQRDLLGDQLAVVSG